jgi:hypothetical protein
MIRSIAKIVCVPNGVLFIFGELVYYSLRSYIQPDPFVLRILFRLYIQLCGMKEKLIVLFGCKYVTPSKVGDCERPLLESLLYI